MAMSRPIAGVALLLVVALAFGCAGPTGAEAVVTANPGCILQIQAGLAAHRSGVRVLHLVELLARAYG